MALQLDTDAKAGVPFSYTLEGDVEDVSRQHIANRTSLVVHPAPWYIGIKQVPTFTEQRNGLKTELVAVGLDGKPVPGVTIDVKLTQVQWISVRRAEGDGFYGWETERKEVPAGEWRVTSAGQPVALTAELPAGGMFILEARADAGAGRFAVTRESFYALGRGYTAWQRYDHNRIDLVPERTSYKPGDTARIMIQSPWEQATALVTTEREGIRTHRQFALTSTQESIDVPIVEGDIPNVYVSVLLVKGRTKPVEEAAKQDDPADPGKPSFRLGYVQLNVEDATKRLTVAVTANKEEYRPANSATVTLNVKDRQGRRHRERSHALGRRLRRAVADRVPDTRRARLGLREKGAAGADRRRPPENHLAPGDHAEGRHGRRRRWRGSGAAQRAHRLQRDGVLARIGRHQRERPGER